MNKNNLYWSKLDHSAKIYPMLTTDRNSYVFRVSATLNERVNPTVLNQAIYAGKKRFPIFYVRIKRGLFWYYFEENLKTPILSPETPFVCEKIDEQKNHKYLFKFMYYEHRISLEINHVLTDGAGAIQFLNAIVFDYLKRLGKPVTSDGMIPRLDEPVKLEEMEDCYHRFDTHTGLNPPEVPKAYVYKNPIFKTYGTGVINSFIDTAALKTLAKEKSVSMTQYIIGLITVALIKVGHQEALKKHPINICVPVNLRPIYHVNTYHNFSLYFHTTYQYLGTLDFDDILTQTKASFKKEYTPEKIQSKLDTVCEIQRRFYVRMIPLPLKYLLFKLGYQAFGRKPTTVTVSNFGNVTIPKSMEPYITSFSYHMGAGLKHAIAIHSYKGKTSIVFSRATIDTRLEEAFFKELTKRHISVQITSNYWEKAQGEFVD